MQALRSAAVGWLLLLVSQSGCRTTKDGPSAKSHLPATSSSAAPVEEQPQQKAPQKEETANAKEPPGGLPTAEKAGAEDSTKEETKRKYRVAALGDSITDEKVGGGGYLKFLRKACPASQFVDVGRGGDMTNQMLRRLRREFLPLHQKDPFDTLIVFGGVNDLYSDLSAGRTNDKIESDLASIYATAKDLGLRVVAVTVSPWGGFSRYYNQRRGQNTRLLNSWILGRPAEGGVDVVVDSYPILSCGTPDKLCPEYQGPRPDGLHPGKRGHEILGQALKDKAFADCR